jgi:hypothetical protein
MEEGAPLDLLEVSRREKRQTFTIAIILAMVVFLVGAPVVQAAVTRIKGTVKVKDTGGGRIDASAIPDQGLTDVPGSSGALDVQNFPGGVGLLGVADCAGPLPGAITLGGGQVVTNLLMTGSDGTLSISSTAVAGGALSLLDAKVTANEPNVIADLSNGLGVTAPLTFTATGTDCKVVVLGSGEGVAP